MNRLIGLQIFLILITVPLQLLILTKWTHKNIELIRFLSPNTWFNWFISFAIDTPIAFNPLLHKRTWKDESESAAIEVYHIREKYGYFASKYSTIFLIRII
jgi:hypothetical protein